MLVAGVEVGCSSRWRKMLKYDGVLPNILVFSTVVSAHRCELRRSAPIEVPAYS